MPFSLISWVSLYGDRFILEKYFSLNTIGVYSLLIAISMLILMTNEALIGAVQPYLFEYYSDKSRVSQINTIYKYYISAVLLITSIVILGGSNIQLITDNLDFLKIIEYLPLAGLVYFISSYYNLFKARLMFQKKTRLISALYAITALLTIILYFILIPSFSIWGAILSNLTGFLLISFIFFYYSYKQQFSILNFSDLLALPMICCSIIIGSFLLAKMEYLTYSNSSLVQFFLISIILSLYFKNEIKMLFHFNN